ncbi:helix-turn-helix transcriptional regulator [Peribacillus simplex]|uniref:helix-turn-helix transcriptional regulator n=1 Tax=Peribacillus simplex TaxID=1478 RepID=UPI0024C1EAC7|nr:YafY family protein [Peribacillus simplex]WHY58561.1 YafY family protein [Peribacillus simplex]
MAMNRYFEIVYILLNKKNITAKELAERFEVSTRTIYRDIDALSAAGIPIYSSQGRGGGISLIDEFVLNTSLLSEAEQNGIMMALQGLTATSYPEADELLSKLSILFKKEKRDWIEVDFSPWGSKKNQKELFHLLKEAIFSNRIIKFIYFSGNGTKRRRTVSPNKLIYKDKSWYVNAYCLDNSANRTFKVNRMKEVVMTEELFIASEMIKIPSDNEETGLGNLIEVQLKIAASGAFRVYDEFEESDVEINSDGSYTIRANFPDSDWLLSYILSFGSHLRGVEPEGLRQKVTDELENMKRYLFSE